MSAFSRGEVATLGSSSPLDGMPTLRHVFVTTDVAEAHPNRHISHSASHFQAEFAKQILWHPDCPFS